MENLTYENMRARVCVVCVCVCVCVYVCMYVCVYMYMYIYIYIYIYIYDVVGKVDGKVFVPIKHCIMKVYKRVGVWLLVF